MEPFVYVNRVTRIAVILWGFNNDNSEFLDFERSSDRLYNTGSLWWWQW